MRLLIVSPCYYPAHRYGGPVKSTHEMASALVNLGVDVTVFTTNADGEADLQHPVGAEIDVEGVKVWYFQVQRPRSFFRSRKLSEAIRTRIAEFDLVHINWLYVYTTMVAARECLRQNVPYVMSPRGMLDPNAIAMSGKFKKTLYLRLVERRNLMAAAIVHFSSQGEFRQALRGGWNLRAAVAPLGLDVAPYDRRPDPASLFVRFPELRGKRLVLFLGRLNYIKGLDLLARAWPRVMELVPSAHLVLAGPDDHGYAANVRRWLKEGGVSDHVTFTGMLLGEDKLAALHAAEICVVPSYLESFGITVVEAMACRKPVVITDRVNICDEVAEARAGIVVPCDASGIAQGIVALLQDPAQATAMGENGRMLVDEQFTIGRAASRMLEVYRGVVGRNHHEGHLQASH